MWSYAHRYFNGEKYAVIFHDSATGYYVVYAIPDKSKETVLHAFQRFLSEHQHLLHKGVGTLWTDNGNSSTRDIERNHGFIAYSDSSSPGPLRASAAGMPAGMLTHAGDQGGGAIRGEAASVTRVTRPQEYGFARAAVRGEASGGEHRRGRRIDVIYEGSSMRIEGRLIKAGKTNRRI